MKHSTSLTLAVMLLATVGFPSITAADDTGTRSPTTGTKVIPVPRARPATLDFGKTMGELENAIKVVNVVARSPLLKNVSEGLGDIGTLTTAVDIIGASYAAKDARTAPQYADAENRIVRDGLLFFPATLADRARGLALVAHGVALVFPKVELFANFADFADRLGDQIDLYSEHYYDDNLSKFIKDRMTEAYYKYPHDALGRIISRPEKPKLDPVRAAVLRQGKVDAASSWPPWNWYHASSHSWTDTHDVGGQWDGNALGQ